MLNRGRRRRARRSVVRPAVHIGRRRSDARCRRGCVPSNAFAELSVAAGLGNGSFGTPVLSGAAGGDQPATLLADVTADGKTDAVSVIRGGTPDNPVAIVIVNAGDGNGTFSAGQQTAVGTRVAEAAVGDIGGDGAPDIAFVGTRGPHGGRTGLFVLSTVGGQLTGPLYYGGPGGGLTVDNLNGDATSDVATVGSSELEVFLGRATGALAAAVDLPAGPDATDVTAISLGGNRVDIVELDGGNPEQLVQYEDALP